MTLVGPIDPVLGVSVNPAKLSVDNDEVVTGASAAQAGGLLLYPYLSLATINAVVVKASAGRLYGFSVANSNAATRFLKFYDRATTPDPSAGHLPVWRHVIAANTFANAPPIVFPTGLAFANGIAFVIVGLLGDTDETAIGANDVVLNLAYK